MMGKQKLSRLHEIIIISKYSHYTFISYFSLLHVDISRLFCLNQKLSDFWPPFGNWQNLK